MHRLYSSIVYTGTGNFTSTGTGTTGFNFIYFDKLALLALGGTMGSCASYTCAAMTRPRLRGQGGRGQGRVSPPLAVEIATALVLATTVELA